MRLAVATVFCFFLTACQTLALEEDPDRPTKLVLASAALLVDGVHVYAALPLCGSGVGDGCRVERRYRDAKLLAQSTANVLAAVKTQKRSSIFLTAALLYTQYQVAKTVAGAPGPTDPEGYPTPAVVAQLEALGMLDVLINSADERVQDAASVNTSVADLVDHLQARAAALP